MSTCAFCGSEEHDFCESVAARLPLRADALQAPLADHGISPAQLREKVEALEKRVAKQEADINNGILQDLELFKLVPRLDAALKRIEELERKLADCEPMVKGL